MIGPQFPEVLRIQPVEPEHPSGADVFGTFTASLAVTALSGLFLMLAAGVLHRYFPGVPAFGYWESIALALGLGTVGHSLRSQPWKWARR